MAQAVAAIKLKPNWQRIAKAGFPAGDGGERVHLGGKRSEAARSSGKL
jgi:hypothetical protein